jgi:hypothetical protein
VTGDDDPTTEELKAVQVEKLQAERELAREADESAEERTHGRRADKAEYLARKLAEQEESEKP